MTRAQQHIARILGCLTAPGEWEKDYNEINRVLLRVNFKNLVFLRKIIPHMVEKKGCRCTLAGGHSAFGDNYFDVRFFHETELPKQYKPTLHLIGMAENLHNAGIYKPALAGEAVVLQPKLGEKLRLELNQHINRRVRDKLKVKIENLEELESCEEADAIAELHKAQWYRPRKTVTGRYTSSLASWVTQGRNHEQGRWDRPSPRRRILLAISDYFEELSQQKRKPVKNYRGVCPDFTKFIQQFPDLTDQGRQSLEFLLARSILEWPLHSGDTQFPVPGDLADASAEQCYMRHVAQQKNMYDPTTSFGAKRLALCHFLSVKFAEAADHA